MSDISRNGEVLQTFILFINDQLNTKSQWCTLQLNINDGKIYSKKKKKTNYKIMSDFSSSIIDIKRQQNNIFEVLSENNKKPVDSSTN